MLPFLERHLLANPLRTVSRAVRVLAFSHLALQHGVEPKMPVGPSMLPTFEVANEMILISHWHRRGRGVVAGDVVTYSIPTDPRNKGVKRVLGLPGDYVLLDTPAGVLDVRRHPPEHPAGAAGGAVSVAADGDISVEEDDSTERPNMIQASLSPATSREFGDNLPASRDSRDFGPLPLALVNGKVLARMWPLWEFQWLRNPFEMQNNGKPAS